MSLASQVVRGFDYSCGQRFSRRFSYDSYEFDNGSSHICRHFPASAEELAAPMRAALPALGDEVIAEIRESVPEYAQPLEGTLRGGRADRRRRGAQAIRRRRRAAGRGLGGVARRVREPRPGRVPAGANPRSASCRVPPGRPGLMAAGRRRGDRCRRHGSGARGAGRGDLRLHRRALLALGRGVLGRAGRVGRGAPAPARGAGAHADRGGLARGHLGAGGRGGLGAACERGGAGGGGRRPWRSGHAPWPRRHRGRTRRRRGLRDRSRSPARPADGAIARCGDRRRRRQRSVPKRRAR